MAAWIPAPISQAGSQILVLIISELTMTVAASVSSWLLVGRASLRIVQARLTAALATSSHGVHRA
jgi:hypothetical protein